MSFEIAGRRVGSPGPLFVIAELGLNHGGSVERALALVDAAAQAGASAVKLQTFRADELVAPVSRAPAHVDTPSLRELFRRFELDDDAHRLVAARARAHHLAFIATPFSMAAVDLLERVNADALKIASGDLTFHGLIQRCARTGKPLLISTGMATLDEVGAAVAVAVAAGARDLALLHCVSAYPVPPGSENLLAISTLARTFGREVGLSDHASDTTAIPVAVALGASLYERHLMLPGEEGVDADVSSLPDQLAEGIRVAARTAASLGHGRKECLPAEAPNLEASRRALHAAADLAPGHLIRPQDIAVLRPASGLAPGRLADLIGVRLTRRVEAGGVFVRHDLSCRKGRREVA
jgi:sialic acid synthase SpsE